MGRTVFVYAAAIWAFGHAALSFYWAAGGMAGVDTLSSGIQEASETREPGFLAIVWATGALKVFAGLLPLAVVQSWGRGFPRSVLMLGIWTAGGILLVYGVANIVAYSLLEFGIRDMPEGVSGRSVRWGMLFWSPLFALGGALFLAAAWQLRRDARELLRTGLSAEPR